jgi:hypothetical protein
MRYEVINRDRGRRNGNCHGGVAKKAVWMGSGPVVLLKMRENIANSSPVMAAFVIMQRACGKGRICED